MSGGANAAWRARIRADRYLCTRVAKAARDRGLVTVQSGAEVVFWSWDVTSGKLTPTGISTDGYTDSAWLAADGRALFRLADRGGDETGHVHRIELDERDPTASIDLTPKLPDYSLRGGDCSMDGRRVVFAAVNGDGFHLIASRADGAAPPQVAFRSHNEAWQPHVSSDAALASIDTTDHNPGVRRFGVTVIDLTTHDVVGTLTDSGGGDVTAVAFAPGAGDRRLLLNIAAAPSGLHRPAVWDPGSGRIVDVRTPWDDEDVEIIALDWSPDGVALLLGVQRYAEQELATHDLATAQTRRLELANGSFWLPFIRSSAFGTDGAILVSAETSATSLRVLRQEPTGAARRVLDSPPAPVGRPAHSVAFSGADGTVVQAWLIRPERHGPHPAVVSMHGGPHWFAPDAYNPEGQAWVDHGFAYLELNYRGSTGRGTAYAEQIWGRIGELELADMAAVHAYLVGEGISSPGQIFLTGTSYGGFLTLHGLGRQPELWAGGFASVAIADWHATYQQTSPALQAAIANWFGGPPERQAERYKRSSPITYAANVRAPLVILQGTNDTRTPPGQMRAYETLMRDLGKDITVEWFDSGHGLSGTAFMEHVLELYTAKAESALRAAAKSS